MLQLHEVNWLAGRYKRKIGPMPCSDNMFKCSTAGKTKTEYPISRIYAKLCDVEYLTSVEKTDGTH